MELISAITSGTAQASAKAAGVKEPPKVQRPEEEAQGRTPNPVLDTYVPEEEQEPGGRYWLGKDEDGQPKIYFDDPEQKKEAEEPEKRAADKKTETCIGDTSKVDREIKQLKKKQAELEQRLNAEQDEAKIKDLKKKLAQVENELRRKDNDTYRRQHTTVSSYS
ncbi:MAG: hypothetical protein HFE97_09645 [Oscillospiraceae bacterium]|nr:hypothetical protein [Oscillospiraceae bacterium]